MLSLSFARFTVLSTVAAAFACTSAVHAAPKCDAPVTVGLLPDHADGAATLLKWPAPEGARRFRVWAQWRVPEGEVVRTHEELVTTSEVQLPPSPARWRPLKLSVELQSVCDGGALSPLARLRQMQFDARAEASCPPVEELRFERAAGRLVWAGGVHDRFEVSFHQPGDGRALGRHEVVGASLEWPAPVRLPAVIRALRACGEEQRSRATYLLAR